MSQPRPILTYDRTHAQYLWPSGRIAIQYGDTENFHGWVAFSDVPFPGLGQAHPTTQAAAESIGATLLETP